MTTMEAIRDAYLEAREAGLPADDLTMRAFEFGGRAILTQLAKVLEHSQAEGPINRLLQVTDEMIQLNQALTDLAKVIRDKHGMTLDEFLDTLKKLNFIDRRPWMDESFWRDLENDPADAFIRADDADAERIWEMIKPTQSEVDDLRQAVIAFGAPTMVMWAKDSGLPPGHLHPEHYDLLKRCGARMVDFTRGEVP